jgi:quercetin dioxygenase-like cupin family protein
MGLASWFRASLPGFRWQRVEERPYKREGSAPFKDISRQVLFDDPALGCELRYFEIKPGGYSTLERHEHVHGVMILSGRGECLVGGEVREVKPNDLVHIPSMTWHQFRAAPDRAMGFLCMVNSRRDKGRLPDDDELKTLRADQRVARFLDGGQG